MKTNCINKNTKAAIINSFAFDKELLQRLDRKNCTIIHRMVGPVSIYRGTDIDDADQQQWEANSEFADVTVFQSQYSLEAHNQRGIHLKSPVVIMNGVDPDIFYPPSKPGLLRQEKIKIIATGWSTHPNKGFDTYKWLDENLDWRRYHFTYIGRTPMDFKNIRTIPAVPSRQLAEHIRNHDIYITAARHETCSNALLEGLACNLPAIYANSGGNKEIVKKAGFGFTQKEEIPELLDQLVSEYSYRQKCISIPSLKEVADNYLKLVHSKKVHSS